MSDSHHRGAREDDDSYNGNSSTPWVGAFERVIGDQSDQYGTPKPRPKSKTYRRSAMMESDSSEILPPSRSAAASPFKESLDTHQRMRSGSLGTSSPSRPIVARNPSSFVAMRKAMSSSGPQLVAVSEQQVNLEDIYLNHAPGMMPLRIKNLLDDQRILLRLGSTLGRGLTFMKRKRSSQDVKEKIVYPTNTVKWAKADGLHPTKLRDIRHMLANLELSDSLILGAGGDEDVFICFRPSEYEQDRLQSSSPSKSSCQPTHSRDDLTTPEISLSPQSAPEVIQATLTDASSLLFRTADANGFISLRASMLSSAGANTAEEGQSLEPISSSASNMSSSSSSRPPSFYSSYLSSTTSASASSVDDDTQIVQLPFYASYCCPQLSVTKNVHRHKIQRTGVITLDFGEIFVGQSLEMEVYLQNQSEIDMFWQARLDDADSMLHDPPVTLLDEDGPIEAITSADDHPFKPKLLEAGGMKKIKIAMKPSESYRDYEQVVTITNMHNAGNNVRILVRANMLGEARDDALSILSGDIVDFGDCAGGRWTKQLLVLRNNCEQILDVHFNVEKGIEANFQLAELAQKSNEDHLLQYEPPMMANYPSSSLASTSESEGSEKEQSEQSLGEIPSPTSLPTKEFKSLAPELATTPLARPQPVAPMGEPPFFVLPCQDSKIKEKEGVIDEEDDVDASSLTSQAGSMPGSPKIGSDQAIKETLLDPPNGAAQASRFPETTFSEGDRESNAHYSRPSSEIISSQPSSKGWLSLLRGDAERNGDEGSSSVRSEVTAISHDSRLGPFLSGSSQHGGSTSSQVDRNRSVRHGGAAAISGLRSVEQGHGNQLEELILRPGAEYRVIVSYRPSKGPIDALYTEGKLVEKTFSILLDYARSKSSGVRSRGGRERKSVLCRIRTCTSFISVSPKLIDFGLANVGTKKSASIAITNHSELTTRVDLRYVSKVLSMYRDEVSIPPLQTLELRVDFFPRRVNEGYRKQVTVANLLNRSNDEIFEVRSKNIDEQKISFHSLFYRILTSTGSNYIDFGDVNINCTRLRSFSIENISKSKLTLELSAAHSEDLKLYVKAKSFQPKKPNQGINRYAELEAADEGSAVVVEEVEGKGKTSRNSRVKGADFKEKFLESMSQDLPASIRKENTSWRIAQKDSHYRKGAKSKGAQKKNGETSDKKEAVKKAPLNLMSALKKGGKGKLTQKYGRTIAFKDGRLLSEFEYLDLAAGPPVDGKRISVKSKKYQMLDGLETGKTAKSESKRRPSVEQTTLAIPNAKAAETGDGNKVAPTPALTGKRKSGVTLQDAADVSQLSLDELIVAVESQSSSLSTYFLGNPLAEEQSVRTEINLQRELQKAIATAKLEPIEILSIEADDEQQVIAVYTPNGSTRPHIQGNARKQDSRIFMRLVDFSTQGVDHVEDFEPLLRLDNDELPVRELMVKSNICRSILELSQPHINFGQMIKGDVKTRKILIQNRSEWALRFCIRKSGSISSGDIKLKNTDRYGVVPGHGKREVEFVFCPTLTGAFQEKLTVENVADRDKDEIVFLKANVRKVSHFKVEPSIVEFNETEALPVGEISTGEQSFSISNVSTKTRTFVIGVDLRELNFQTFKVDVLLNSSNDTSNKAVLSKAEEEEVEHISQKLKIANRKGQMDKIKKYQDRLSELGLTDQVSDPLVSKDGSNEDGGNDVEENVNSSNPKPVSDQKDGEKNNVPKTDSATSPTPTPLPPPLEEDESSKLKQVSSVVTLTLAASQSKKLLLRLRPIAKNSVPHTAWQRDSGEFSINVRVHEMKNTDDVQMVEIRGRTQKLVEDQQVQEVSRSEGWVVFSAPLEENSNSSSSSSSSSSNNSSTTSP